MLRIRTLTASLTAWALGALLAFPVAAAVVVTPTGMPAATTVPATVNAGDRIKLVDDHDAATESDRAVYYVGSDNKRYVFPTLLTYLTWYKDFNGVKTVTAEQLAALPLGGNVAYRPGTRLVKIQTDPKVYAVEPGGVLRWVATEADVIALYGADWNKRVDDVVDSFFGDYRVGAALNNGDFPDGSLVKRKSDGAIFLISDGAKRRLSGTPLSLGFDDGFMMQTTKLLTEYPDGGAITVREPELTDAAQRGGADTLPAVPTWSSLALPANAVAIGGTSSLIGLRLRSAIPVTVTRMTFRIDAVAKSTSTTSSLLNKKIQEAEGVSGDKGGLVYLDNAQLNLTGLRIVDTAGSELFGRRSLALDVAQDETQTITFTGALALPAGETKLWLRADGSSLLPVGESYRATLIMAETSMQDASSGAALVGAPTTDIQGPQLTSQAGILSVSGSTFVGRKTYVRGTKDAALAAFTVQASPLSAQILTGVTLQGYVDDESDGTFLPGSDTDGGVRIGVSSMVPLVNLHDSTGAKIAGPVEVPSSGRVTFEGFERLIAAGGTATFVVRGDLDGALNLGTKPNLLAFDIADAATDLRVTDDAGKEVVAKGTLPNGGVKPVSYVTIKDHGKLTISWSGAGGPVLPGTSVNLGTLSFKAEEDSFVVDTVTFWRTDAMEAPPGSATLTLPAGSDRVSVTQDFVGSQLTFTGLSIKVEKDKTVTVPIKFNATQNFSSAAYGQTLKVKITTAGPLVFHSMSDGKAYDEGDMTATGTVLAPNTESSVVFRFSDLTIVRGAAPENNAKLWHDMQTNVLEFALHAGEEGSVRVAKLAFKLTPSDIGVTGANNDSLERWADMSGDFEDDNQMADLVFLGPENTKMVIGEDASTRISYSIVRGGKRSTVSSTLDSRAGDYAILEYLFDEGNEYFVGAGGKLDFRLVLDLSVIDATVDRTLKVELLGGAELPWTDVAYGAYVARADATGVPLTASYTIIK